MNGCHSGRLLTREWLLAGRRPGWEDRFWAKVHTEPNSGCWLWAGAACAPLFYGRVGIGTRASEGLLLAHRVAYALIRGECPEGLVLRHRCDNPPCVNPAHLVPGEQVENLADLAGRGRWRPKPVQPAAPFVEVA